jgi:hypothetical protein
MVPARVAQAGAPWLFGFWLDRHGLGALAGSASLGLLALVALLALRGQQQATGARAASA